LQAPAVLEHNVKLQDLILKFRAPVPQTLIPATKVLIEIQATVSVCERESGACVS
jgi:hypothetical protein